MKTTTLVTIAAVFCSASLVVLAPLYAFGNFSTLKTQQTLTFNPTTTVAIESSNNTSAVDNYQNPGDGNMSTPYVPAVDMARGDISKVDTHSLLYTGNTTNIFVHLQPWFCFPGTLDRDGIYRCNGHILTGYNSNDTAQVHKQVNDMISRGIQGTIVDWYGSGHSLENGTTLKVMAEAQTHSPATFKFAVMDDGGQYSACMQDPQCNIEAAVIADLTYAYNTYILSPNYMKALDGHPYMFFFDLDGRAHNYGRTINWATIWNGVSSFHYDFIFENNGGFTHAYSTGGFAWIQPHHPEDNYWSTYLDSFYSYAKTVSPPKYTFGTGFKGFDDSLAGWGSHRLISQHCGQVWLNTFSRINSAYSQSTQLANIQLVTWNDYDEGSELETGIDNCATLSASVNPSGILSWTISGDPSTLDHFTVFASTDDTHLMVLQDALSASQTSLDLTPYKLPANTYLRVKAVGKPSILNHLSAGGVQYSGGSGGGIQGQVLSAVDQHPIQGATVSCSLGQRTTDANGYYIYTNVPPGQYTLTASATGWLPNSAQVTVNNSMVTQNIQIATAGKVTGTVTKNGQGYSGAQVTCSGGVIYTRQTYTTNAQGVYASSWIPVGNYSCFATLSLGAIGQMKPMIITAGNTTTLNFQF